MNMELREIEVEILKKVRDLIKIQIIPSVDLKLIKASQLKDERCISFTTNSVIGKDKYETEAIENGEKVYYQHNINVYTIGLNFTTNHKNVKTVHNYFNNILNSIWWAVENKTGIVIESMGNIVPLSGIFQSDYREKYNFDMVVRVEEKIRSVTIPEIKKVNFRIKEILSNKIIRK